MGAAISTNVSNQIISTSTTIANSYIQNCNSTGSQKFNLDVTSGCTSNIGTINITNQQVVDVTCVQNVTTQSSMQSDIQAQIMQQALAAVQSIGGPAIVSAQDIENFSQNAAQQITNAFTQTCIGQLDQQQNIRCSGTGSNLNIGVVDINNNQAEYANCTSNNSNIDQLRSQLKDIIEQKTNASEANTLITFVIVGLIIFAFIGIFFLYSINGPIGWVIVGIFILLIIGLIVYATFAFTDKLYPFNQRTAIS